MSKTLVAFFSRAGEQYHVGVVREGNTKKLAQIIAEKTGGDLFEIKVVNDNYPTSYMALTDFAKKEKQQKVRPEIAGEISNLEDYDTVFIGYPNWWSDMPMAVYTFLEKYDLSDKKVYKFCTHEGSGGVHPDDFAIYGHVAQNYRNQAEKAVVDWLNSILTFS